MSLHPHTPAERWLFKWGTEFDRTDGNDNGDSNGVDHGNGDDDAGGCGGGHSNDNGGGVGGGVG